MESIQLSKEILEEITNFNRKVLKTAETLVRIPDVPVGTTPAEVVYRENKLRVLRYKPIVEEAQLTPLVVIFALINRYYILDLQPERSVVQALLKQGFDVYMIDWGTPSAADKYLTIDDYVNGYIDHVVDAVRHRSGSEKVTILGYCMGGTFAVIYAALHPEKVRNLIVQAAGVDFENCDGIINAWSKYMDADKMVDTLGNIPGNMLNAGFLMLNPVRLLLDKYVSLFENIENEEAVKSFLAMEKWIFDSPPLAGETYREFVKKLYQKNQLIKNELEIGGKIVDLRKIEMPTLVLVAENDNLVPAESTLCIKNAIASKDLEIISCPTGHIGLSVSSIAHKQVWPKVAEWLRARSK